MKKTLKTLKNSLFQMAPIIVNTIFTIFWLTNKYTDIIAFPNLIVNILAPFYILIINRKKISSINFTKKQSFFVLIGMFIILKMALGIYFLNGHIGKCIDEMGMLIYKALWIFNSIVLFIGWFILLPLPKKYR